MFTIILKALIKLLKKVDYTMSAITGLDGLRPTLSIIKYTKNIAKKSLSFVLGHLLSNN